MTDEGGLSPELIGNALQLNATQLAEAQKTVTTLMEQRRALILKGRDSKRSYVTMASDTGLSKAQVYKIVRDGFREGPIRDWDGAEPVVAEA